MKVHLTHSWRNFKRWGWHITPIYLHLANRKIYYISDGSMGWDYKYVLSVTIVNLNLTIEWGKYDS